MGGDLTVESEPGQGAGFVVTLPVAQLDSTDARPAAPATA